MDPAENVPLLAPLLDIPLPEERTPTSTPEELRRRQLAALTAWMLAGARTQPIVLAVEDVHWADPSTLDLLRGIAERGALAPLLALITARQEFRLPWGVRSHHGTISLVPLDRHQVWEMVAELSARHALPKEDWPTTLIASWGAACEYLCYTSLWPPSTVMSAWMRAAVNTGRGSPRPAGQRNRRGARPVGERRHVEIDAFARDSALPVERQMRAELGECRRSRVFQWSRTCRITRPQPPPSNARLLHPTARRP